jgi:hypothetical protein
MPLTFSVCCSPSQASTSDRLALRAVASSCRLSSCEDQARQLHCQRCYDLVMFTQTALPAERFA